MTYRLLIVIYYTLLLLGAPPPHPTPCDFSSTTWGECVATGGWVDSGRVGGGRNVAPRPHAKGGRSMQHVGRPAGIRRRGRARADGFRSRWGRSDQPHPLPLIHPPPPPTGGAQLRPSWGGPLIRPCSLVDSRKGSTGGWPTNWTAAPARREWSTIRALPVRGPWSIIRGERVYIPRPSPSSHLGSEWRY